MLLENAYHHAFFLWRLQQGSSGEGTAPRIVALHEGG